MEDRRRRRSRSPSPGYPHGKGEGGYGKKFDDSMMRGDQQQRKRQRTDDHQQQHHQQQPGGHRDDDRAERLECERRERMARLRADDGDGSAVRKSIPSNGIAATSMSSSYDNQHHNNKNNCIGTVFVGAGSSRGMGRGKSIMNITTHRNNGDNITNMRQYHDNNDEDPYDKKDYKNRAVESADDEDDNYDDDDEEEEEQMRIMMGFDGFGTTKGKVVADNQHGAARGAASKNKGRKYRQYMNRKGGFNKPLDKMN